MSRFLQVALFIVIALAAASPARAQRGIAVGAHAGTLGPGLEVAAGISPQLNVRVVGNYLPFSRTAEISDLDVAITYDANLRLLSVGALADWFPFRNQLRATAGVLYNDNNVSATITPIESYEMNGRTFSPDRIGDLSAEVDYGSPLAPYVGLGFGNAVSHRFSVAFDLGAVYTNAPSVHMSGNGMIAPTAKQAPTLEDGLSSFRWWPVVNLGFNVRLAH